MYDTLRKIAHAVGGTALDEFMMLESIANRSQKLLSFIDQAQGLVANVAVTKVGTVKKPIPAPSKRKMYSTSRLPLKTVIPIQLMLLRASARNDNGKALKKAYAKAYKRLGISRKKNRRRIVGAFLARTQGRSRPTFLARVAKLDGKRFSKRAIELAKIYSKIEGKEILPSAIYDEGLKRK